MVENLHTRHFHISHNARYLAPLPLPPPHPLAEILLTRTFVFHFSWVLQPSQEKNAYAKLCHC